MFAFAQRRPRAPAAPTLALDAVRRRLEIFVSAFCERPLRVEVASVPPPTPRWRRMARGLGARVRGHPRQGRGMALATIDGDLIRLPPSLDASRGIDAALASYRAMALALAERARRGSVTHAPPVPVGRGQDAARLARDLYHVAESAAAERAVATTVRGLAPVITARRAAALAERPLPATLRAAERDVEVLVRAVLAADPASANTAPGGPPIPGDPRDSRAWAESMAAALRARHGRRFRYRGVAPVEAWGAAPTGAAVGDLPPPIAEHASDALQHRTTVPVGGSRAREAERGEDDDGTGLSAEQGEERPEVADARAPARASTGDAGEQATDPDGSADPARPDAAALVGIASHAFPSPAGVSAPLPPGIHYPEWDVAAGRYAPRRVTVREEVAAERDPAWADAVLRAQAPLVRRIRERFEPLRARRTRLGGQPRGDELDLSACVRAFVELRTGHAPGDRLYIDVRPARRPIATLLLVDISGSTDLAVDAARQVIDVEREAVLLASAALDALGDPYAVLAFSSRGAADVRMRTVKRFAERNGDAVRRRVTGLYPNGNTRLGGALRHATALLARQPAGHRLLLLLSDGQPNDSDDYQGHAAIEDARRAVLEARAAGVVPFCLTVDREEPEAAGQVFGAGAYTVLRDPAQLPHALVRVVGHLLGR